MHTLLEQVQEAAHLADAAQWGPWYRNTGLEAVDVEDRDGQLISSFALGQKSGYQNACFVEAARNLNWPALAAALSPTTEEPKPGLPLALESYRALIKSVVESDRAPEPLKAWLGGVGEKIEEALSATTGEGQGAYVPSKEWAEQWFNENALVLPSNIKDLPDLSEDEKSDTINKAVKAAGHCLLLAFFVCKVPNFITGGFADGDGNEYELSFRRRATPTAQPHV